MSMLIAAHAMNFAHDVASRVAFLADGEIVALAPPADLFGNPRQGRA